MALEHCDLNTSNVEFETVWIEIKNKFSKNIVCGSVYRHPHNFVEFFQYLELCLISLAKEIKEIYFHGDFNFDLLKTDTDHSTQHFFNFVAMACFLVYYGQLVTENTSSVIDSFGSFFTNNFCKQRTNRL